MHFTGFDPSRPRPAFRSHGWVRGILMGLLGALRITTYAVLALLRPLVVASLTAVAYVCLGLCAFSAIVGSAPHFPFVAALFTAVVCAVLIVVYYALMELLLPG